MPHFEFIVKGPPVSVNAKNDKGGKKGNKYQVWITTVREAAQQAWPPDGVEARPLPPDQEVAVEIINFYAQDTPDVDNIIKPILDALGKRDNVRGVVYEGVVYKDDDQVYKVTSTRQTVAEIDSDSPLIASALEGNYKDFLLITVIWTYKEY